MKSLMGGTFLFAILFFVNSGHSEAYGELPCEAKINEILKKMDGTQKSKPNDNYKLSAGQYEFYLSDDKTRYSHFGAIDAQKNKETKQSNMESAFKKLCTDNKNKNENEKAQCLTAEQTMADARIKFKYNQIKVCERTDRTLPSSVDPYQECQKEKRERLIVDYATATIIIVGANQKDDPSKPDAKVDLKSCTVMGEKAGGGGKAGRGSAVDSGTH